MSFFLPAVPSRKFSFSHTACGTVALFCVGLLSGCAYIGDPKPPTLDIPTRVTDLRAAEYGEKILIEFTLPPLTREGLPLEDVSAIELRVIAGAVVRTINIPPRDPGAVKFDFPVQDWIGKDASLAVRAIGPKGKASDYSNTFIIPVGVPLATPASLQVVATGDGVQLKWQGSGPNYRIFRAVGARPFEEVPPVVLGDTDKPEYLDAQADYGMTYRYFVEAVSGELRQSEISQVVSITPIDTFAPAVPKGLSVVAGVGSIELAWERNTESDFQGYNIFRSSDDGATFEKVADKIPAPTYSDRDVMTGKKYIYALTSIDTIGNESARSMTAEATAQ